MKQGRFLFILIATLILPARVFAVTSITKPNFPSCEAPQGELKVTYSQGTHGVPGIFTTFTGKDSVYILSEDTLTQCLCIVDDGGIQTNWWKVSSLSLNEIEILVNEGWIYVPDGSLWGLERAPYMAFNKEFDCNGDNNDKDDSDKEDKNDKHDGPDDDEDEEIKGDILGFAFGTGGPMPMVLAATGNLLEILGYFTLGILSLTAFVGILKKYKSNE